jgi:hypothetical protein
MSLVRASLSPAQVAVQTVSYFIPRHRLGSARIQLDHPALNFGNPRRVGSFVGSGIVALDQEAGQRNVLLRVECQGFVSSRADLAILCCPLAAM